MGRPRRFLGETAADMIDGDHSIPGPEFLDQRPEEERPGRIAVNHEQHRQAAGGFPLGLLVNVVQGETADLNIMGLERVKRTPELLVLQT